MVNQILKHKTRNGILAFLFGLVLVVTALYIDVFRGDTSGTIGLYQVAGAITGYLVSAVGVVLVMKETDLRKTIRNILFYGGGAILLISFFADFIGVAGPTGFDRFQILGMILGLAEIGAGVFVITSKPRI